MNFFYIVLLIIEQAVSATAVSADQSTYPAAHDPRNTAGASKLCIYNKFDADIYQKLLQDNPAWDGQCKTIINEQDEIIGLDFTATSTHRLGHLVEYTRQSGIVSLKALKGMELSIIKAPSANLRSLDGLEDMPLKELWLSGNPIGDISLLSQLKLEKLDISDTQVGDISAIRAMPLVYLDISGSRVADLSALEHISTLKYLFMHNIPADSLKSLRPLSLTEISISVRQSPSFSELQARQLEKVTVTDEYYDLENGYEPIAADEREQYAIDFSSTDFSNLKELSIHNSAIHSLASLKNSQLTRLRLTACKILKSCHLGDLGKLPICDLDLSYSNVTDISPLQNLPLNTLKINNTSIQILPYFPQLKVLKASNLKLAEISDRYTQIIDLDIAGTLISSLPPDIVQSIQRLNLSGTPAVDLAFLQNAINLVVLSVNDCKITDLAPLRNLPLNSLSAANTQVKELAAISELTFLDKLNLKGCSISNLDQINRLSLKWLSIAETSVSQIPYSLNDSLEVLFAEGSYLNDLGFMRRGNLRYLNIANCPVKDFQPLQNSRLFHLYLSGTAIQQFDLLAELPLKTLYIDRTSIENLSSLKKLRLNELNISFTQIKDLSPLLTMPIEVLIAWDTPIEDFSILNRTPIRELIINSNKWE